MKFLLLAFIAIVLLDLNIRATLLIARDTLSTSSQRLGNSRWFGSFQL